jgi:PAS domain S-box-containing protein
MIICLAAFLVLSFLTRGNAAETKEILVLHSYHDGLVWTDDIMKGIHSVFNKYDPFIEIHVEYMDTKRYFDGLKGKYLTRLHDMYKDKYSEKKPDMIISSDDNAFQFLLKHHNELFPGTPIVFCGVNNFEGTMLAGHDLVTGVIEFLDKKANVDIALKLHPEANKIAIITDTSETGNANRKILEQLAGEYEGRAEFVFLDKDNTGLTLQELLDNLRQLPEKSIVYYSDFLRSRGEYISQEIAVPQISSVSKLPIYTHYNEILGLGVVGGKLVNGYSHGRKAAQMASDILRGKPVSSLPVYKESINTLMFDYKQLTRFGIDEKDLPEGSEVIDRPSSFYREYKWLVWSVLSAFSILVISLIIISVNVVKRKKAEEKLKIANDELEQKVEDRTKDLSNSNVALKDSEAKYRDLFESATDAIFILDLEGNFIDVNSIAYTRLGYTKEELLSMHISELGTPEFTAKVHERLARIREQGFAIFESAHIRKDGTVMPVEVNVRLYKYNGIKVHLSFIRDISERKRVENQIRSSLKEKDVLLREIHHRVKNNMTVISSMLALHAKLIRDKQDRQIFDEACARIKAMAIIHEKLYQSGDMSKINAADFLSDILKEISSSYAADNGRIAVRTDIQDITLSIDDAIPLGLIINELVSNAMKHAFPELRQGEIKVDIALNGRGEVRLSVSDNGVGVPDDIDNRKSASLGLTLVDALVRQVQGELKLYNDNGARFEMTFLRRES